MLISRFPAPLPELVYGVSEAVCFLGVDNAPRVIPNYDPVVDALVELFVAGAVVFHRSLNRPGYPITCGES